MNQEKCLYPTCSKDERYRGLCTGHYNYASLLVRQKKTTWQKLIDNGKAKESKIAGRKHFSWFLDNKEEIKND